MEYYKITENPCVWIWHKKFWLTQAQLWQKLSWGGSGATQKKAHFPFLVYMLLFEHSSRMHTHIVCIMLKCIQNKKLPYIDRKFVIVNKTLGRDKPREDTVHLRATLNRPVQMGSKIYWILYFVLGENKATQDWIICSNSRGKIKITPDSHPGFQSMASFLVLSSIKTWAFSAQVSIPTSQYQPHLSSLHSPTPKRREIPERLYTWKSMTSGD